MDHHVPDNASETMVSKNASRATSPKGLWRESKDTKVVEVHGMGDAEEGQKGNEAGGDGAETPKRPARYRPRTFPYQRYLPYQHEDRPMQNLSKCLHRLYMAVASGDFVPGATHWTRELRGWMQLKFDLPRDDRIKLVKLYYELALAPGMDSSACERFTSMFTHLTKRKHYLKAGEDLYLDWRPLFREFKAQVLPNDTNSAITSQSATFRKNSRTLLKLVPFAQLYFDPIEVPHMFDEILPYYSASNPETAHAVVAILNLLMPTTSTPEGHKWQPQHYLPTLFHIWSTMNRSKHMDLYFVDLMSRIARDCLVTEYVSFSEYGIFTKDQASLIFTAILRLLEIPIHQVPSPYSIAIEASVGLALLLDRDSRKFPTSQHLARWITMSLSPASATESDSILTKLEGLIQGVETFFHPSNTGGSTRTLSHLIYQLSDFFVMRWNREQSQELATPSSRRLDDAVKRRFVLCLREVTFMGIFSKSGTAVSYALSTLQNLAFLEPELILPGALQRIYPSMRGSVEVHRTISSIKALQQLTRSLTRIPGFRCHVTALLGLALPGIDANDLSKTVHTLTFMQAVFYEVPMCQLADVSSEISDPNEEDSSMIEDKEVDEALAANWVSNQIDRLEAEELGVEIDYTKEMSSREELAILRSSTAALDKFLSSLLDRVFDLIQNLPDAAKVKAAGPEELITSALPSAFQPLFSTMSEDLYDVVLQKMASFVSKQVAYQARDAMGYMISCLCKVNPAKALSVLVPILDRNIRSEIDNNGAGSSRTTGADVLPRDKALVWNISLLSMSIVHVGNAIIQHGETLLKVSEYMEEKCIGIPRTHASNLLHHILVTLSMIYTIDPSLYDQPLISRVTPDHWSFRPDPRRLNFKWHYPDDAEIQLAITILQRFAGRGISRLEALISDNSPIKRDGTGKEWSDEMSRYLVMVRVCMAGAAPLFDPRRTLEQQMNPIDTSNGTNGDMEIDNVDADLDFDESNADADEEIRPTFHYPTGEALASGDARYETLHSLHDAIGETLHNVHRFLTSNQQDDVTAFNSLYMAYRSWFIDIGIERSAHTLDRSTRLLVSEIEPYKVSGLHKQYPRPLLVRRANVYHLQRLKHNSSPRFRTDAEIKLLDDLVESSVSLYTEIRRTAQQAGESAMKVLIGARKQVIPKLIEHFEAAVKANDYPRIKGAMYSLLFGSLAKPIGRDWKNTPSLMKAYVGVLDVDKPSIQKISATATIQVIDMTRQTTRTVLLDKAKVDCLVTEEVRKDEEVQDTVDRRRKAISKRFDFVRQARTNLAKELATIARESHWRKESTTASLIIGLSLRFDDISPPRMIDLVVRKSADKHPSLRQIYSAALLGLFAYIDLRAIHDHSYEKLLMDQKKIPGFLRITPDRDDPEFTERHLAQFAKPEAELYIDEDWLGWLVWGSTIPAFEASKRSVLEYDSIEQQRRSQIGELLDRDWFSTQFQFFKQEPKDSEHDKIRMSNVLLITNCFNLMFAGVTTATFDEIKELIKEVFGDGTDKHQHRATAEIMAALLGCAPIQDPKVTSDIWSYAFPIIRNILEDGLTPENSAYWFGFLDIILQNRDPRRSWPLVEWVSSLRLDMTSNAAFKESSKISLIEHCLLDYGWHFRLEKPIQDDFLAHLDHPYKGVRHVVGSGLGSIFRSRHHESFKDVETLVEHEKKASSIGSRPYEPSAEFSQIMNDVFAKLETWRKERTPGQQTASSYTSGSKTVLTWLETVLNSYECTQLTKFLPDLFIEALLHMMNVKEDPELPSQAIKVYRQLANIPMRPGEEEAFVSSLVRIGQDGESWHQRLRIMLLIQAIYFRQLFLMSTERQQALIDCVSGMLEDTQLEVRLGASFSLSTMIRCSPNKLRQEVIEKLRTRYIKMLSDNQMPRNKQRTPPTELNKIILIRHAAVLGLGGLVQVFPFASPPPLWIPEVLATLATKACGDSGIVGKSANNIISDFKKTRQDTWHMDVKAFQPDQLEDLEGVLWKSYFA